jgi:hypothetical protein
LFCGRELVEKCVLLLIHLRSRGWLRCIGSLAREKICPLRWILRHKKVITKRIRGLLTLSRHSSCLLFSKTISLISIKCIIELRIWSLAKQTRTYLTWSSLSEWKSIINILIWFEARISLIRFLLFLFLFFLFQFVVLISHTIVLWILFKLSPCPCLTAHIWLILRFLYVCKLDHLNRRLLKVVLSTKISHHQVGVRIFIFVFNLYLFKALFVSNGISKAGIIFLACIEIVFTLLVLINLSTKHTILLT